MIKTNAFFDFTGTAVATELAREIGAGGIFSKTGKKKRGHDAATDLPGACGEKKSVFDPGPTGKKCDLRAKSLSGQDGPGVRLSPPATTQRQVSFEFLLVVCFSFFWLFLLFCFFVFLFFCLFLPYL